ncbi:MAG: AAA family ATPase [Desulfovibrio sp.]|jgi:predicted ATP-dependent protease|nr:AAA family ATPase [Desulfovibrio sp.]
MSRKPVPSGRLRANLDPARIPHATSDGIARNGNRHTPQQRALQALDLGLHITAAGYNIYLAGEADLGRSFLLRDVLGPRAKKESTPPDLIYVFNFNDHDAPALISLPAGQGRKLKQALNKVFSRIRKDVASDLESNVYIRQRTALMDKFQSRREELLGRMNRLAGAKGFNLGMDDSGGMTLYPLVEGKRLNEQEYESLAPPVRARLKIKGDSLMKPITGYLRKLARAEEDFHDQERSLERELVEAVLRHCFDPLVERFAPACDSEPLSRFFNDLRAEALDRPDSLMPADPPGQGGQMSSSGRQGAGGYSPGVGGYPPAYDAAAQDDLATRFDVNLFVDNGGVSGAPIVFEDHPTAANLMGCIEREAEMGALVTDFSLIKSGSIHRANGGYLVLHIEDALQHPAAWEALLRALRAGLARIEDADEEASSKSKGLRPEPVPLRLKVILVGKEELHEMLLLGDDRFSKLFKIKAHLTEHMPRDSAGIRVYLSHIRRIIDDDGLLPFDREALAGLVDFGSRLIEDQRKLSLKYPLLREIMVEASAFASLRGEALVTGAILQQAQDARTFRSNLFEEAFMEEYDRGIIKVSTSGEAVGKVNGLSVSFYGDFEFGLPHEISCTVGAGSGGIIDLERDAKLGGPIHTKAMMILKSYLVGAFAHNKPLVLTGSLGFEQNYAGVEGDSASGAELAALLSALSRVPVRLSLAFTGAVGQFGQIMAVGGVTRKIEGFFEVCKRHGLTGSQGVILPRDNIAHVLLHGETLDAVSAGRFHIYAVRHITEAMEILTGLPAGRLRKDGGYTRGSLFHKADERLRELSRLSLPRAAGRGRP